MKPGGPVGPQRQEYAFAALVTTGDNAGAGPVAAQQLRRSSLLSVLARVALPIL